MRFSLLLLPLALLGCNKPQVETRIQTVHCVTPEQYRKLVEAMPPKIGKQLTGNSQEDFKLSAGQNVLMRMYANGLLTVIGGCTAPVPPSDD